jgi:biotin operon repressor
VARNKIKSVTDQRTFTIVYNDFLESGFLDYYEKILFIYLKKYADNRTLQSFPSLNTLHKVTGISRSKIQECIKSMEDKGILKVQRRESKKGHISNLYTLYDSAQIWGISGTSDKDIRADNIEEARMIAELEKRGYVIIKKELASATVEGAEASSTDELSSLSENHDNEKTQQSQASERYSREELHDFFDFNALDQLDQEDVAAVENILYETLNTTKEIIRIGGEDKPRSVVVGKLMKLNCDDIAFVINQYNNQRERIKNPQAYILTQLYNAKEQNHLDLMNQGHVNGDF